MKGLVLELRDGLAAVLREDGQVVTTAMACQVGQTVELPAEVVPFSAGKPVSARRRRWASGLVAAVLALAVVGGGYTYNTAVACSYVSVDAAEASIELAINRRGQVIDVRAVDEGSAQLAEELSTDLRRMPLDQALDLTMDWLDDRGFLPGDNEPVVIGVMADNEKREAELDAAVEKLRKETGSPAPIWAVDVTPQERQDAAGRHQSGGRYAYEKQNPPQAAQGETQPSGSSSGGQTGNAALNPSGGSSQSNPATPPQPSGAQGGTVTPAPSGGTTQRTEPTRPSGNQNATQPAGTAQAPNAEPTPAQSQDGSVQSEKSPQAQSFGGEPSPATQEAVNGDAGQRPQTDDGGTEQTPPTEPADSSGQENPVGFRQTEASETQPEIPEDRVTPAAQPQAPSAPSQQQREGEGGHQERPNNDRAS